VPEPVARAVAASPQTRNPTARTQNGAHLLIHTQCSASTQRDDAHIIKECRLAQFLDELRQLRVRPAGKEDLRAGSTTVVTTSSEAAQVRASAASHLWQVNNVVIIVV
jgi:hypothetical protein